MSDLGSPAKLLCTAKLAARAADDFLALATRAVARAVASDGRLDPLLLDREQHRCHGLAWLKAYVVALDAMEGWGQRLRLLGRFGEREQLILAWACAEYLARIVGGIPMSQGEIVRPRDLGLGEGALAALASAEVQALIAEGGTPERRARLATLIADGELGDWGQAEDSLEMVKGQFERFAAQEIQPFAQDWHRQDLLIPMALIEKLGMLGVFGLTLPEEHGGLGMGKEAMCIVTEELSRGYIGVGSLPTRSEIAGELIRQGGTDAQKRRWLPGLASGATIPTAVFTEPDTGSDLASIKARAVLEGGFWRVSGAKTWITHAARADLMTMLVRTDPAQPGYRGLSILLAEKPRGTDAEPFPPAGLTGSEIPVLGYRGMKEYTLAFDGFRVPEENLLGGVPGQGFKQLMATFETARIQTAARALGVARNALELGLAYARDRRQFGKPLMAFRR